jgi:hypothetical protein
MKIRRMAVVLGLAAICFALGVNAQTTADKVQATDNATLKSLDAGSSGGAAAGAAGLPGGQTGSQSGGSFFGNWLSMVTETQSEQPRWMTPLATTPRLEQEFRYDVQTQPHNRGLVTNNFGVSKGLQILPAKRWEVILAVPPYLSRTIRIRRKTDSAIGNSW